MYSNDDGYIYFTDIEEAKALYKEEGEALWEIENDIHGWRCEHGYTFCCSAKYYRRRLTTDFRIRKEFRDGDPVCWAGANGVIKPCHRLANGYHVFAEFKNDIGLGFTADGKFKTWHKNPSLSHGHDSTVDNQKYPVERVKTEKAMSQADEVAECIPHWQENLRLAIEGKGINGHGSNCPLCKKYHCSSTLLSSGCPIEQDTGLKGCAGTPWSDTTSGKPEHVLEMLNYLIDLERSLRKAGK